MSRQGIKILALCSVKPVPCARLNYMIKRFLSDRTKVDTYTKPADKSRMKAWQLYQYGGPSDMTLSHKAKIPKIHDPNEILVEIHAASVNPIDVLMRGGYGRRLLDYIRKRTSGSLILGRDFSGVVVKTGAAIRDYKPGDEVWGALGAQRQGSHAEFAVTSKNEISLKPLSLSHIEAASIPYVAATVWSAVCTTGGLNQENTIGKRILVYGGSGGIGTFAIQLMSAWGGYVTTVCSTDAVDLVKSLGADDVVDYKLQDTDTELKNMEPFDFILDPLGQKTTGKPWNYLKKYSRSKYVTLSTPLLSYTDQYGVPVGLGMWGLGESAKLLESLKTAREYRVAFFEPNGKAMAKVASMVDDEKIRPVVEKVFPFLDLPHAYKKVGELHGRGKTVICMKPV